MVRRHRFGQFMMGCQGTWICIDLFILLQDPSNGDAGCSDKHEAVKDLMDFFQSIQNLKAQKVALVAMPFSSCRQTMTTAGIVPN